MERRKIGTVKALWRYPVKSMLGEQLGELRVTPRGTVGDRAWALRDAQTGRIASAKKFAGLLKFRARYEGEPRPKISRRSRLRCPTDARFTPPIRTHRRLSRKRWAASSSSNGSRIPEGEHAGIDTHTIFGDVPFEKIIPGLTADKAPDSFRLHADSFYDSATFHLIASGTLAYMSGLTGAKSDFDYRRFRPNLLVDTGGDAGLFVEDGWVGGVLEVGDGIRITAIVPALRCVMTTLAQQDLPRDLAIIRTIAERHQANLGAFTSIEGGGRVRVGDPVYLVR